MLAHGSEESDAWQSTDRAVLLGRQASLTDSACGSVPRDSWLGEFEKAQTDLSTSEAAKKSASAVQEVSAEALLSCLNWTILHSSKGSSTENS